jgi:hypothetical protein
LSERSIFMGKPPCAEIFKSPSTSVAEGQKSTPVRFANYRKVASVSAKSWLSSEAPEERIDLRQVVSPAAVIRN